MRTEHRDIQEWIKQKYEHRYRVAVEIDGQNYLTDIENGIGINQMLYCGITVVRLATLLKSKMLPFGKALLGASILADYSIRELQQKAKPRLIFVVYNEQGIELKIL